MSEPLGRPGEVAALFGRAAAGYDAARQRLVPGLSAFYAAAAEAVGPLAPGARVLDLGAGTGLLSACLLARWPGIRPVLVDLSAEMLAQAAEREIWADAPPEAHLSDLRGPLPEGRVSAAVSALAIHHLEHADQQALFVRLADRLPPGGRFVNAEQIAQPSAAEEAAADAAWEAAARAAGAGDGEIAAARERMGHDRCATCQALTEWLEAAGFAVEIPWAAGRFAVIAATRFG